MNNVQKAFKQKAQLGARAADPLQKMQLGPAPHMHSGKPGRMASGLRQRFADGGKVYGEGGPTQDKVKAKLSPGEYVLPADTVAAVGAHNLDGLRAATHTPTAPNAPAHFANGGPVDPNNPVPANHDNPLLTRGADGFLRGNDAAAPAPTPGNNPLLYGRSTPAPAPAVAPAIPAPTASHSAPTAPAPTESFLTGLRNAPGRIIDGMQADMARSNALQNGTATPAQLKQHAEDKALFNNPAINNPWSDIPFLGAGAEALGASAAAPGIMGSLKNGLSKVTNILGRKAAPTAEAKVAAPIAAEGSPIVVNGIHSAERVAADAARNQLDARYAAAAAAKTVAPVASKGVVSTLAPLAGKVASVGAANLMENTHAPVSEITSNPANVAIPQTAAAAPQAAPAQAESQLPAGLRPVNGQLNGDALFAAQPAQIASAPIAAAQDKQVQSQYGAGLRAGGNAQSADGTPITTNSRYADPAAAEAYYRNRTESQLSRSGIEASNAFIRANAKSADAGTVARDNAAFASRGLNVTKSVDAKGNVTYGNTSANPYMVSNFGGETGNDIAATNHTNEATNLAVAKQAQAEQVARSMASDDKAERARLEANIYNNIGSARRAASGLYDQHAATQRDKAGIAERERVAQAGLQASINERAIAHEQYQQNFKYRADQDGITNARTQQSNDQSTRTSSETDMRKQLETQFPGSDGKPDAAKVSAAMGDMHDALAGLQRQAEEAGLTKHADDIAKRGFAALAPDDQAKMRSLAWIKDRVQSTQGHFLPNTSRYQDSDLNGYEIARYEGNNVVLKNGSVVPRKQLEHMNPVGWTGITWGNPDTDKAKQGLNASKTN